MTNATLRQATEADTPFAREAHHAAYKDFVVREWGEWNERAQDDFFAKEWDATKSQIIVSDTAPCGYVTVIDNQDHVFIDQLVVLPQYQGKGIATSIIDHIIEEAKHVHKSVRLHVFKNNKARDLYRRLGFKENIEFERSVEMEINP